MVVPSKVKVKVSRVVGSRVPPAEEDAFHRGPANVCVWEISELLPPQQLSSTSLPHFSQGSW